MLSLDDFLEKLNYSQSNNYRNDLTKFEPETAHLFRDAKNTGVKGIYMFRTSPTDQNKPPRPAVFIAQAQNDEEARRIHKNLWNLANAPIIAILTPNRVILYSGFNYSPNSERVGLLDTYTFEENDLRRLLALLSAQAIDSGRIWKGEYKDKLNSGKHVHARLLKNLKDLGDILEDQGLKPQIAHNLIGKYVYISYLYDREILSQKWLAQQDLRVEDIFGSKANARSLARLNKALEERFNGKIFPIDFDSPDAPFGFSCKSYG